MRRLIEANIDEAGGRGAVQVAERDREAARTRPKPPAGPAREPAPTRAHRRGKTRAQSAAETHVQEPPRLQVAAVIPEPRPRPAYVAAAAPAAPRRDRRAAPPAPDASTRTAHEAGGPATPGMRWIVGAPPAVKAKFTTRIEPKPEPRPSA